MWWEPGARAAPARASQRCAISAAIRPAAAIDPTLALFLPPPHHMPKQVSVNDCVIKAAALALAEVPAANALWDAGQEAAVPAGSGARCRLFLFPPLPACLPVSCLFPAAVGLVPCRSTLAGAGLHPQLLAFGAATVLTCLPAPPLPRAQSTLRWLWPPREG